MKLDQLRRMALFAMVAREGSFTAVSNQQSIATSAISSAISQLEAEIDTRLFHRSTRKLTLTDEGAVFLKHCQAMLFEAQTAHEELSQLTGQLAGQLTITASQLEAKLWLLPALTPLLQANPKLTLNLIVNDQRMDLIEHGIDIAIRSGQMHDSSYIARALTDLPECIVASPIYIQTHGEPKTAADLSQHKIIGFSAFDHPNQLTIYDQNDQAHTATLTVGAKTDSVEIAKNLAKMGLGLARLPLFAIEQELRDGQLVQVLQNYHLQHIKVYAVTIKRDLQPTKVKAALESIQAFMRLNT